VGDDQDGKAFMDLLQSRNMDQRGIVMSKDRMTTVKERMLSSSQQLLRIDRETTKPLSKTERAELCQRIQTLLPEADVVIFEDYDKGVLDKKLIKSIIETGQKTR
jgi:bifunctional ADP-heptose synthase (sugar kinase/adenylyltransferase)